MIAKELKKTYCRPDSSASAKLSALGFIGGSSPTESELHNFLLSGVTFVDAVVGGRVRFSSTWNPATLDASFRRLSAASRACWAASSAKAILLRPMAKL